MSTLQGRGFIAVAPIAATELVAIRGSHIVSTAALAPLPERLRNSVIQIADGLHLAAMEKAEYEPVMLSLNHSCEPSVGFAGNTVPVAMRDIHCDSCSGGARSRARSCPRPGPGCAAAG